MHPRASLPTLTLLLGVTMGHPAQAQEPPAPDAPPPAEEAPPATKSKAPKPPKAPKAPPSDETDPKHEFAAFGGATARVQDGEGGASGPELGLDLRRDGPANLQFGLQARYSHHRQAYTATRPDGTGDLPTLTLAETRLDLHLGAGLDLLPFLLPDAPIEARPVLGFRLLSLNNAVYPTALFGMRVGAEVAVTPDPHLRLRAAAGATPRLAGTADTLSLHGVPIAAWDVGADFTLSYGDGPLRYGLVGGWRYDPIVFEHTTRTQHTAFTGVHLAI